MSRCAHYNFSQALSNISTASNGQRGEKVSVDYVRLSRSNKILVVYGVNNNSAFWKFTLDALHSMNLPAHHLHHWVSQDVSSPF